MLCGGLVCPPVLFLPLWMRWGCCCRPMFLLGVLARLILGLLCGGWVGCFTWILRGIGRVRVLCSLISCGVGCPVDLGVVGGLLVSWVRFDTGTPLAANQGLQRA